MPGEVQLFGAFLRETVDVDLHDLVHNVAESGSNYNQIEDLREPIRTTLLAVAESMAQNDLTIAEQRARDIGVYRARDDFSLTEMAYASIFLRNHIWKRLYGYLQDRAPWPPEAFQYMENFNHTFYINYSASVGVALQEARQAVTAQAAQLEAQHAIIRELDAPVMPVHEGVLVLPLVGAIDSRRAVQVMERLLETITDQQADMVIVDITGVPMVDTSVANYLLQTARAANLVGAHVILVGIGAEIAQTIVQLGVDLSRITTLANLQEGIAFAYQRLGYQVV